MSQTVELAIGTRLKLGREIVELAEAADFTFPTARDLDEVAELLAASNNEDPLMSSNLRLNASTFERQIVATSAMEGGFDEGTAVDVTHGPRGERRYTSRGIPPVLVPATSTVEDAADTILVATFDKDVNSLANDYAIGFSVKVDGVARAINAAARQADNKVIHFTLAAAVVAGHAVLLSFNSALSDLKSDDGAKVQSFVDAVIDNNVVA